MFINVSRVAMQATFFLKHAILITKLAMFVSNALSLQVFRKFLSSR